MLIKLSSTASANERLLTRRSLMLHLQESHRRVLIEVAPVYDGEESGDQGQPVERTKQKGGEKLEAN